MGMLGALAGAGSGMQDFSTLLNEKAKMDWQAQQADIKWEREQHMEELRNSNEQARLDMQLKAQATENDANRKTQVSEGLLNRNSQESMNKDDNAAAMERVKAGFSQEAVNAHNAMARGTANAQADANVSQAERIADIQLRSDKKKQDQNIAEMHKQDFYVNASPEEKKLYDSYASAPEATKLFVELKKAGGKEIPFEQVRLAFEKGQEQYGTMGEDKQKVFKAELSRELGRSVTDMEAASFLGQMHVSEVKAVAGQGTKVSTGSTTAASGTKTLSSMEISDVNRKIASGEFNIEEVKKELNPKQWSLLKEPDATAPKQEHVPVNQAEKNGEELTRKVTGMLSFNPENVPIVGRVVKDARNQRQYLK